MKRGSLEKQFRSSFPQRRHKDIIRFKNQGFTLIELMIVVAGIAILSAVVIPAFLGFLSRRAGEEDNKEYEIQKSQVMVGRESDLPAMEALPSIEALPPITESADVGIKLAASHHIQNLKVYTRFDAELVGEYVFRSRSDDKAMELFFSFPAGTTHASDVSLKFIDPVEEPYEPAGVIYTLHGIRWIGLPQNGNRLKVRVTYSAQGYSKFVYEGPGTDRADVFRVVMELDGVSSGLITADALQPTKVEPGRIEWYYENLVTERDIVVELPGSKSPMGRILLFLKLAGLAVLLFGLGFMYLSDLKQPGQLDDFRWGHFLLLSLTYVLSFLIFAIMGFSGDVGTWPSIVISLILSLPLLVIHTGRFLGISFALSRVLPLSVFSFAIVINGVYGGIYRKYVFIAIAVITVALITLSYRTWAARRKSYKDEKERLRKERNEVSKALNEAEDLWKEARSVMQRANTLLEGDDVEEHLDARSLVEEQIAEISDMRAQYDSMKTAFADMPLMKDTDEHKRTYLELREDVEHHRLSLQSTIKRLRNSFDKLSRRRRQLEDHRRQLEKERNEVLKAINESENLWTRAQEIVEETNILLEDNDIEEHMEARSSIEEQLPKLVDMRSQHNEMKSAFANISSIEDPDEYKRMCSKLKKDGNQHKIRLQNTIKRLKDSLEELDRLREQLRIREKSPTDMLHCISCGAQSLPSIYCPACGVLRPVELVCQQCNEVYRLPIQLIDTKKMTAPIHCPFCGKAHAPEVYSKFL